jgi:hypothetical protein
LGGPSFGESWRRCAGKKLKHGGDEDEQQSMINLYYGLSRSFNWTPTEIDEIEISVLFGYIAALSEEPEEKGQYIDEVL